MVGKMAVDCEGEIGIAQGRCVARGILGTKSNLLWSDYQYIIYHQSSHHSFFPPGVEKN